MTKQGGLGDQLMIGGYRPSGDINSISRIGGGFAPLPSTGIDKYAMERMGGERDGGMSMNVYFNTETDAAHDVFSPLPRTSALTTYFRGFSLGGHAASVWGLQLNYDPNRGADGSLLYKVDIQGNGYGLDWGIQVTPGVRTDTGAANGTGVDFGTGSTAFGLQAYLQVEAFTGTDATIKLQESSDDGAGDAWADVTGGAFTQVTGARVGERLETSRTQTVERYLRVVTTTSAGFTSLSFAVVVDRNVVLTKF